MQTFRAMSTEVTVAAPGLSASAERDLAHVVAVVFAAAEQRFSRFRADSELSRLNRAGGPTPVSPALLAALVAARAHAARSGGLFDPTIARALEAAGYDRPFARGALDRAAPPAPQAPARFADVAIDEAARVVACPPGVALDLGGVIKGRTVDEAARLLPAVGFIDAGGDAALRGDGPDGDGWEVDVEDPADARRVVVTLRVRDRAVATSAPNRRRWRAGDVHAHHLIDPRTGRPAVTDLAQATALAATAEDADVAAKVAFLLGADAGARWLERAGLAGVLLGVDGAVHLVGDVEVVPPRDPREPQELDHA